MIYTSKYSHPKHFEHTNHVTHLHLHYLPILDDSYIFPILSSALSLLGLLWVSGIFGRVRKIKQPSQVSELNQGGCPPTEVAAAANDKEALEVPKNIGELTVSKLLVHPIKVSL